MRCLAIRINSERLRNISHVSQREQEELGVKAGGAAEDGEREAHVYLLGRRIAKGEIEVPCPISVIVKIVL